MLVRLLFTVQGAKLVGDTNGVGGVAVPDFKTYEEIVWAKGFDADGLADGSPFAMSGTLEISGTTTYDTVGGGSKTLFVFQRFDLADAEKTFKERRKRPATRKSNADVSP